MPKNTFSLPEPSQFWDDDRLAFRRICRRSAQRYADCLCRNRIGLSAARNISCADEAAQRRHSLCHLLSAAKPTGGRTRICRNYRLSQHWPQKPNSLCGTAGNKLFKEGWHYPDYGVYICDCPSAGFDLILLDYRQCGPDGEPSVAYVDMEKRQVITLAPDFATFLQGLVEETELTTPEADRAYEIAMVEEGTFFTAANQNLPQLRRTAGRAVDSLGSPAGGGRKKSVCAARGRPLLADV